MENITATIMYDGKERVVTFDPKEFTPETAKQWLKENEFEIVEFMAEKKAEKPAAVKKAPAKKSPLKK